MVFNKDTFITVMIVGWDKYNVRNKDIKNPWWFSCSNNILEDPDFEDFSNSELNVWLFLLSLGSKRASPVFTVGYKLATRMRRRFRMKDFISAIQKLHVLGIIEVEYQKAATIRPPSSRDPAPTEQDITEHNNKGDHVKAFEKSFDQKSLDEIQGTLSHIFGENVPPDLIRSKPKLLLAYGSVENFRACILEIYNSEKADPTKNEKWRSYMAVAIKKQAGLMHAS